MEPDELFAMNVFGELTKRAQPFLEAALAERGVASPSELPVGEAQSIFEEALATAATRFFPGADVPKLRMGLRNLSNPAFAKAFDEVRSWKDQKGDAFAPAVGPSAAIILAGFGVPVVPIDKRTGKSLAPASADLETVISTFGRLKTAVVGYEAHKAEFYALATDCIDTLRTKLLTDERFVQIKELMHRSGATLPPSGGVPFRHFTALFSRWPGDQIKTGFFPDDHPNRGSVILSAGWDENGIARGAPNEGVTVALKSMVIEVATNPARAHWLTQSHTGEKPPQPS